VGVGLVSGSGGLLGVWVVVVAVGLGGRSFGGIGRGFGELGTASVADLVEFSGRSFLETGGEDPTLLTQGAFFVVANRAVRPVNGFFGTPATRIGFAPAAAFEMARRDRGGVAPRRLLRQRPLFAPFSLPC